MTLGSSAKMTNSGYISSSSSSTCLKGGKILMGLCLCANFDFYSSWNSTARVEFYSFLICSNFCGCHWACKNICVKFWFSLAHILWQFKDIAVRWWLLLVTFYKSRLQCKGFYLSFRTRTGFLVAIKAAVTSYQQPQLLWPLSCT